MVTATECGVDPIYTSTHNQQSAGSAIEKRWLSPFPRWGDKKVAIDCWELQVSSSIMEISPICFYVWRDFCEKLEDVKPYKRKRHSFKMNIGLVILAVFGHQCPWLHPKAAIPTTSAIMHGYPRLSHGDFRPGWSWHPSGPKKNRWFGTLHDISRDS